MTEPFFSVVIPAYNASAIISRCLDSVASQTEKSFEIIVVDDGSLDDTGKAVESWAQQHIDIPLTLIAKNNGGPASARNEAIRHAKGKYVCFLDVDDSWLPEKLSEVHGEIEENQGRSDVYTHDVIFVENDKERLMECGPERDYLEMLEMGNCLITSATVVARKALIEVGLFDERKDFIGTEDFDMWLKLLHSGRVFIYIHQALTRYWVMDSSLSQDYDKITLHHQAVIGSHVSRLDMSKADKTQLLRTSDYHLYLNIGRRLQISRHHKRAAYFFKMALSKNPFSVKTWIAATGNKLGLGMRNPLRKTLPQ